MSEQKKQKAQNRPTKVEPLCTILDNCGGCSHQSTDYKTQLINKQKMLVDALGRLCSPKIISPVEGLRRPFGYRTRLLMPASPQNGADPPFQFGFYAPGTTRLTDASGCPVQHPLTLSTLAMVRQALRGTVIRATAPRSQTGWLHGLAIRVDPPSGASEVTLIGRNRKIPGGPELGNRLASLPGVTTVALSVQPQRSSYLLGEEFMHLAGARRTAFQLGGQSFRISPGSFFQTCAEAAELLAAKVLSLLPDRFSGLADLYGGVGVFTRLSEKRWRRATVVESNQYAIADLKNELEYSGKKDVRAIVGRVEDKIDEVIKQKPDVAILDPPRAGCHHRVISGLARAAPPTIIYISCGLEALARDAAALVEAGYKIESVSPVDMFPHTPHLEVVVKFQR